MHWQFGPIRLIRISYYGIFALTESLLIDKRERERNLNSLAWISSILKLSGHNQMPNSPAVAPTGQASYNLQPYRKPYNGACINGIPRADQRIKAIATRIKVIPRPSEPREAYDIPY